MDIELQKWNNNIGFLIPPQFAKKLGVDEHSILEVVPSNNSLFITKKGSVPSLDQLLESIPEDYEYPQDVRNFLDSDPIGQEMI